jgi:hypothetical protein
MKRIKLTVPRAGKVVQQAGDELNVGKDVGKDEARALVDSGQAIDISGPVKRSAVKPERGKKAVK